jgi:hypothetical protein
MLERLFASRKRPCFKRPDSWDTLSFDLSGSRFEITLPAQDYEFPEDPHKERINLFDEKLYSYKDEPDRNGYPASHEGISDAGIFRRNWFTYGPFWEGGNIGVLQCSAVLIDISRMVPELNCFNPEHLERLALFGLYYSKGPGFGINEHTCPVNWQIRTLNGSDWVYFESWYKVADWEEQVDAAAPADFSVWLISPLFDDKYLLVTFSAIGSVPVEASNLLMLQRIETIIPSIKLQLSPEALKQQAEAKQKYPAANYSQTREPEPWAYYGSYRYGDPMKGESRIVFEGSCSPPPPLF